MQEIHKTKLVKFASDPEMCAAVKELMMNHFSKASGTDLVETLAAERIAINLLKNAFKEIDRYANQSNINRSNPSQIGL